MWKYLLVSLCVASAQNIVFDVKEIQCKEIDHPYNKYYEPPCLKWKRNMKWYGNKVSCVVSKDLDDNTLSGCTPAFGEKDDYIRAEYKLNSVCKNNVCDSYEAIAEIRLNNPSHPIVWVFMLIFILWTCQYRYKSFGWYPYGRYNYNKYNANRISWNRIN